MSQPHKFKTRNELRCVCTHKPMLANYGIDSDGIGYIHVRVHKQGRIISEVVVKSGVVTLYCRDCGRWLRVTLRDGISQSEVPRPKTID